MGADVVTLESALSPREFRPLAGRAMAQAETDAGEAMTTEVRRRASRHNRTGYMARRVKMRTEGDGIDQVVDVHAGGKVAHLVIGGTAPHVIRARGRSMPLIPIGTSPIGFARSVHHPGTRPDPFVATAVEASTTDVRHALDVAGSTIVRTLARNGG